MQELTQEMKSAIQYGVEQRDWEFKPPLNWHESNRSFKLEITRAAMAFSNTPGGGNIVIGISQPQDRSEGVAYDRIGLSDAQLSSYDVPDDIARFISDKSNLPIKFALYGGEAGGELNGNKFVVIKIFESESYIPIVCVDSQRCEETRIIKNAIYIRPSVEPFESREIESNEEWDELILRLLRHKEEFLHSDLMAVCERIVKKEKRKKIGKVDRKKSLKEYDKFLRRDKL